MKVGIPISKGMNMVTGLLLRETEASYIPAKRMPTVVFDSMPAKNVTEIKGKMNQIKYRSRRTITVYCSMNVSATCTEAPLTCGFIHCYDESPQHEWGCSQEAN